MPEENKVVDFKFEGRKLIITVDSNKDGEAVLSLSIDLSEVADEVLDAFKK